MSLDNTPYDDAFRTLLNDSSSLIIPVINEVFEEHYTGDEKIIFSPNEHFLNRQNGEEHERITDTSFEILGEEAKKYHWECQSTDDSSMLIRFFEYDTQIALDSGAIRKNLLSVTLPHSAVLFLLCNAATPDTMQIEILTPGGRVTYDIPVMKSQHYTIEEIFEKNLLFLIPFYIFTHEEYFDKYDKNIVQLARLESKYQYIISMLGQLTYKHIINEYTKCTIIDMSKKVLRHIAQKHKNVREGVESIMGGKVLEYEAKTIKNEGIQEGLSIGRKEGRKEGKLEGKLEGTLETLFGLVNDKLLSLQVAASRVQLSEEEFLAKMQKYNR